MNHGSQDLSKQEMEKGLIPEAATSNVSLSGWAQFKLIMAKNGRLKWRSGADFCCEMLAPLLLIFGMSCLSLLVSTDNHDPSPFFTSSIRDASVNAFLTDRFADFNKQFRGQRDIQFRVGQVLFASDDPALEPNLKALCLDVTKSIRNGAKEFIEKNKNTPFVVENDHKFELDPAYDDPDLCESGQMVLSSSQALDDRAVELASEPHYWPILGGVVINAYSESDGVDYSMYFNRSYVQRTSQTTDPFTFYPSSFWLQYSTSGFVAVQQQVDTFFINMINGTSAGTQHTELQPFFQSFPHQEWKYDPFKRRFLSGNFQSFFGYCIIFALSTLSKGIVDEKKKKIKEGMLMMGLRPWVFWASWVSLYFLIFLFVALTTTAASFIFLFKHSSFLIVFAFIFLFLLSVVTLALFLSTLFTDPGAASISAIFFYLACIFTPQALVGLSQSARYSFCLLSPMAFYWGFSVFGTYEGANQGVTFSNFGEAQEALTNSLMLKDVFGMLALDTVLYLFLAWYFDKVVPGDFGAKQPFYFIFSPAYWCGSRTGDEAAYAAVGDTDLDSADAGRRVTARARGDVEDVPSGLPMAVKLDKLRKVFVSNKVVKVAVEEMNLEVFEGQVTALLGHNGAGKSTTFNMLTGLMKPTSGDASVYGLSVATDLDQVRLLLGVCPQHDVLWDQLTVLEHLQLFAALKGVPQSEILDRSLDIIAAVGLTEKREQFSCTLSGGMKRKLSIGIAVIGDSRVVFLDEPTSGMDPYSRRATWDIIKGCKEGRVMLFTTHFMDEADLLGDRIAIMSSGRLNCCGSPLFLKKRFGLGYNLTVSLKVGANVDDAPIRKLVQETHAPGSAVISDQGASLGFQVPFEHLENFPMMFEELDTRKDELQIDSWGISMTTLEEVFLKLAHMKHADDPEERERDSRAIRDARRTRETEDSDTQSPQALERRKTTDTDLGEREEGVGSFSAHLVALFKKRLKSALRDQMNWVLQVIVPMLFLMVALVAVTYGISTTADPVDLNVKQYNAPLYIPYSGGNPDKVEKSFALVKESYPDADIRPSDVSDSSTWEGVANDTFSCTNFESSDFLSYFLDDDWDAADSPAIQAYPFDSADLLTIQSPPLVGVTSEGLILNTNGTWAQTPANRFIQRRNGTCLNEQNMQNYLMGSRNIHKSSRYGAVMWAPDAFETSNKSFLVLHNGSAYHALPTYLNLANQMILKTNHPKASISTRIQPLAMTNKEKANNDAIKGLVLCFFLIIAFSIIPSTFVYPIVAEVKTKSKHQQMISGVNPSAYWLATFLWDTINYLIPAACTFGLLVAFDISAYLGENTSATITILILYGGASIALTYMLSFGFKDQNNALLACIALYAVSGFVLFFVSFIMQAFDSTTDIDKYLRYIYMISPQFSFSMGLYEVYSNDQAKQYSSAWDMQCAGKMMLYLGLEIVVFMWMTLLLQYSSTSQKGCFSKLFHRSPEVPPDPPYDIDEDVEYWAGRLEEPVGSEGYINPATTPIIARKLRKVYYGRGNVSSKVAVRELSFHVPEGEVFGFLGINGAGKTTSLSMLSGEFPPTSGEGVLNGLEMLGNRNEINRSMGYCPQFDALFEKLTGREHLQLYARVKGISKEQEEDVVNKMIRMMDLQDHCEREAGGYSGGNKRKLSVAIALMGSPRIVFLDEPSTGMDPEARRFMWDVISKTMSGRAVILTTHSMEEAEALSHRIGIMVGGRLRCLGTTQHLKNKFGKGYSMELRTTDEKGDAVVDWVEHEFPTAECVERMGGQARFDIPQEGIQLSKIFRTLSNSKEALGLADFAVSQTTLEQVFVKFAAEQEEETGMDAATLKASMRETYPNFFEMCFCRPKAHYEWTIPSQDGTSTNEITVDFSKSVSCGSNPGIVYVNGAPVEGFNPITETDAPGCPDAPCIGCRDGCCGSRTGSCCVEIERPHIFTFQERPARRSTDNWFRGALTSPRYDGTTGTTRSIEVVPYNELPYSNRAHPCFLFVDGKEANTGVERNVFLEQIFWGASKKWCCVVGIPAFLLMILGAATRVSVLSMATAALFWSVIWCCVVRNCCRAKHFSRSVSVDLAQPTFDTEDSYLEANVLSQPTAPPPPPSTNKQ